MSRRGKVLIIGAAGRMGAALARRYARNREVIPFRREHLDVLKPENVRPALEKNDFDAVIYTAGITNVDECETNPRGATLCNTETPRAIAQVCAERGARFIHVSTDYVFKGDDPAPRKETDIAEPINVYGRSKLEGERAVLAVSPEFLVLRVSWLFGPDKTSFPDMILKRAMESDHVEAIADKHSCPTYSEDLTEWIEPLLDNPAARGILHLANSGASSWQAYGQTVLDLAAKTGFKLRTNIVQPISRSTFPGFKAVRPEFTSFDTSKFRQLTGITPRPWEEALEEYLIKKFALFQVESAELR
ncbi:MAG: dTDP-4-dehydrorhamnose reductase [Verrucomicrobia bacterium]|nr:dTDP-4-dehydrorhamnose reductase [Verrucomicrobiota bacterium]